VARIKSQNEVWAGQSLPALQIRIGVNSGTVQIGNYGTASRIRYTALGSHVNLASRLCALAGGTYPVPIVISEYTNSRLPSDIAAKSLASINVKGTDGQVQLFTI
jgi:adenylate cyclase